MGAYGLTEPNAGSDSGGTQTTAVRDGDHYVLNGATCFITNANYAGTFICTAVTDPKLGA
jgi:butyryl-CoA dehydrogenase